MKWNPLIRDELDSVLSKICLKNVSTLLTILHSVFKVLKKLFAQALSKGVAFLDMEGINPHFSDNRKYSLDEYYLPWSLCMTVPFRTCVWLFQPAG